MKFKAMICFMFFATLFGRLMITPRLTNIPTIEGTFEAIAHLFVGFLIIVPFYDKTKETKMYGWMGWGLALFELFCFIVQKILLKHGI